MKERSFDCAQDDKGIKAQDDKGFKAQDDRVQHNRPEFKESF